MEFKDKRIKGLGSTLTKKKKGSEIQDKLLAHLNSIGGVKIEASEEEITTLDSLAKEYMAGAIEAGELSLGGIFKGTDSVEQLGMMWALLESGSVEEWEIDYGNGIVLELEGFVKSFGTGEVTPDGQQTFDGSIKINGLPVAIITVD